MSMSPVGTPKPQNPKEVKLFYKMFIILKQAWVLLRHKNIPLTWQLKWNKLWSLLLNLVFEVLVPAGILYIYTASVLTQSEYKIEELNKVEQEENIGTMHYMMERICKATLLPLSFFLFARRLIGSIVQEKEKGILEYLIMNGMSELAYNLAFILHEAFVIGPMICFLFDGLVWYRLFY